MLNKHQIFDGGTYPDCYRNCFMPDNWLHENKLFT